MANFGVTATMVRDQMFPFSGAFTANGNPSLATVTAFIGQKYAELVGKLLIKDIAASGIDGGSTSAAEYLWCQETLLLMVALRVFAAGTFRSTEAATAAKDWRGTLEERWSQVTKFGASALGNRALDAGASPAGGPTTHISEMSISLPDNADASSVTPFLRKDDPV